MSILSDYTTENYLKAIVKHLANPDHRRITTGELAALVNVTSGTATSMMKKLQKEGYVLYLSHQGCTLTEQGAEYGLRILRRHRLLETFLVTMLGLGLEEAHQEAERLEHSASDSLIDTIAEKLGNPTKDPNGNMIPAKKQNSFTLTDRSLLQAPLQAEVVISRISSNSKMAVYLQNEGIVVGQRCEVLAVDTEVGVAHILVEGEEKSLSVKALEALFYERPSA
ncbi:MAG: metal-dependent transcriptional regulator [Sphaerochaeta sp.]|jgi:DtxR family Mn-dependent transcriptional regulator|nr:metal-dependent transcriptional regulator [Spirochaetales bacterium]